MRAWFLSDIHLRGPADKRVEILTRFITRLANGELGEVSHLFFVGDIFDLWVGGHDEFIQEYPELIESIRTLRSKSVEIHYFEGNHDLHLGRFWRDKLGVETHIQAKYFELGGLTVRVEHGDQMNPDDLGYLFLRSVLRTSVMTWIANEIPGAAVKGIGRLMSRTSRKWTHRHFKRSGDVVEKIRTMIRTHAEKAFTERPFDFIVTGHVHVRDEQRLTPANAERSVTSLNLGCWPGADRFDRSDEATLAYVLKVTRDANGNAAGAVTPVPV